MNQLMDRPYASYTEVMWSSIATWEKLNKMMKSMKTMELSNGKKKFIEFILLSIANNIIILNI
jgi:hypothetical protein